MRYRWIPEADSTDPGQGEHRPRDKPAGQAQRRETHSQAARLILSRVRSNVRHRFLFVNQVRSDEPASVAASVSAKFLLAPLTDVQRGLETVKPGQSTKGSQDGGTKRRFNGLGSYRDVLE